MIFNLPKFSFEKIKTTQVLIFDYVSGRDASIFLFANKNFTFIDTRRERINLRALFFAIISRSQFRLSLRYYNECIRQAQPKLCFIMQENVKIFYELKILNPQITFIVVGQGGNYGDPYTDQWSVFYQPGNKLKIDFLIVDSIHSEKFYSQIIDAKFLRFGNSRLNANLPFVVHEKGSGIGYISEFRTATGNYNETHSKLIELVSKYALINQLDFKVGLSSNRSDKTFSFIKELNFFKIHSPSFISSKLPSIIYLSKCEVIVCCISTLGLELISLGKKVLFVDILHSSDNYRSNYFSKNYGVSGPFWCSGKSHEEVLSKLNYVMALSPKEWHEILSNYEMPIQYFDVDNQSFKKFLENLL